MCTLTWSSDSLPNCVCISMHALKQLHAGVSYVIYIKSYFSFRYNDIHSIEHCLIESLTRNNYSPEHCYIPPPPPREKKNPILSDGRYLDRQNKWCPIKVTLCWTNIINRYLSRRSRWPLIRFGHQVSEGPNYCRLRKDIVFSVLRKRFAYPLF